jgi:glyoxylase-like metal-dependent hydrolase (beta-lactamase superfamily II)
MSEELAPGVYRLDLGMVNAYLVDDRDTDAPDPGLTLVDAGTLGDADAIRTGLADAGYDTDDIDRVLVTHYDYDHVGALAALDLDVPVYAMEPDASYLDGSKAPTIWNHKGLLQRVAGLFLTRPDRPCHRLEDGDSVGGFVASHTPGHSPGHAVFVHEESSLALLGDMVFGEGPGELAEPPWVVCYDRAENAESIRSLAAKHLDFEVAAMGHGDPLTSDGHAALSRLAARLD